MPCIGDRICYNNENSWGGVIMIIDFHTHTFPDKIAERAIIGMQNMSHAAAFGSGTVTGLRQSMASAGIDCSVVLPVATNPAKLASMNDVSIAQNGKDGLVYFGAVHPLAENWKQELNRLASAGIRGIKIHPLYQGVDIDDIRYLRILDHAAGLGLIILMHAGWDIAYPQQVRCSPEMTARALRQVGPAKIVLAHMGGWKNWDQVEEHLLDTGCYLDTAISMGEIVPLEPGHYTQQELPLLSQEAFCSLVRSFGADRILFGTDSPWACQKTEVNRIMRLPLTGEEKEKILYKNAKRLLSI